MRPRRGKGRGRSAPGAPAPSHLPGSNRCAIATSHLLCRRVQGKQNEQVRGAKGNAREYIQALTGANNRTCVRLDVLTYIS